MKYMHNSGKYLVPIHHRIFLLSVILIILVISSVRLLCDTPAYSSNTFLESLKGFNSHNWDEAKKRAHYDALYLLIKERAEVNGRVSDENLLFEELKELDVTDSEDSAEIIRICNIALKDLDTDVMKPGNQFIEEELTKRSDWTVYNSCWHARDLNPFDDLARDVIKLGVPEKDSVDMEAIMVTFPNLKLQRFYIFDGTGYTANPTPEELKNAADEMSELSSTDRRSSSRITATAKALTTKQDLELINNKVYVFTEYEQLDNINFQPFIYPCPDINPINYNLIAAGIDVYGKFDAVTTKNPFRKKILDVSVHYSLTDVASGKIIEADSMNITQDVTYKATAGEFFKISAYTRPFHNRFAGNTGKKYSDYLLGVKAAHGDRMFEQNYHFSLPNDSSTYVEYPLMLVQEMKGYRDNQRKESYWQIPFFAPQAPLDNGMYYTVWIPVTDLPYCEEKGAYCGIAEIYLTEQNTKKGKITEDSYITLWDEEEIPLDSLQMESSEFSLRPIAVDTILSKTPNIVNYRVEVRLPGKGIRFDSSLFGFIRSFPDSKGKSKLLTGAYRDVYVE